MTLRASANCRIPRILRPPSTFATPRRCGLQVLKDDLAPILAANAEMQSVFDLALVPGEPPRLWIDLITAVVMEPDPRTYRLIQDTQNGRETVLETENRAEMVEKIKLHMAHQLVARERRLAATPALRRLCKVIPARR